MFPGLFAGPLIKEISRMRLLFCVFSRYEGHLEKPEHSLAFKMLLSLWCSLPPSELFYGFRKQKNKLCFYTTFYLMLCIYLFS